MYMWNKYVGRYRVETQIKINMTKLKPKSEFTDVEKKKIHRLFIVSFSLKHCFILFFTWNWVSSVFQSLPN